MVHVPVELSIWEFPTMGVCVELKLSRRPEETLNFLLFSTLIFPWMLMGNFPVTIPHISLFKKNKKSKTFHYLHLGMHSGPYFYSFRHFHS